MPGGWVVDRRQTVMTGGWAWPAALRLQNGLSLPLHATDDGRRESGDDEQGSDDG